MLIDKTTNKILSRKIKLCKGFQKAIGLMFHKKVNSAFVFPLNNEQDVIIHTFFVFFPIYVLFLDKRKKVIHKTRMKPFTIIKQKARYVIEFTHKKNIPLRHKLSWSKKE